MNLHHDVRFVNRSTPDFHRDILTALLDQGPAPALNLSWRAEMNDNQIQTILNFLESHKMITKTPLDMDTRRKFNVQFSLTAKYLIAITKTGQKYLTLLTELDRQIDWKRSEKNHNRTRQHRNRRNGKHD